MARKYTKVEQLTGIVIRSISPASAAQKQHSCNAELQSLVFLHTIHVSIDPPVHSISNQSTRIGHAKRALGNGRVQNAQSKTGEMLHQILPGVFSTPSPSAYVPSR